MEPPVKPPSSGGGGGGGGDPCPGLLAALEASIADSNNINKQIAAGAAAGAYEAAGYGQDHSPPEDLPSRETLGSHHTIAWVPKISANMEVAFDQPRPMHDRSLLSGMRWWWR